MKRSRLLWEITRWELLRWLKLKDQLWSLALSVGLGLAIWGGLAFFDRSQRDAVKVAVLNAEVLQFAVAEDSTIEIQAAAGRSEEEILAALERRDLDAVLRLLDVDRAELLVMREPVWKDELEAALAEARRRLMLEAAGLDAAQLADLLAPVDVEVAYHESAQRRATTADKVAAGLLVGLTMLGVFVGFAYQFVAITGEKQKRVTEQIVSAVSPQLWIDGKILGISLLAFISTGTYVVSGLVFVFLSKLFGRGLPIPVAITDPMLWLALALLALGGFLMWNTFFGLIAATIDDPNTSTRSAFMMLPLLPLGVAFLGFANPDTPLMRILGILPPTSPTVLTLRLVLTEVPWWEVALALALLAAAIWLLRKAAGKVFGLGVLIYGKEPSWREMARWIREA